MVRMLHLRFDDPAESAVARVHEPLLGAHPHPAVQRPDMSVA